ncbi:MAG TPA: transglutaminase-like domain-containing protein, partial [Chitinophagaceae bacterium]|nr:transglutaminase-like domain-containing protein [Chitinophagaceae bacterium]
SDYPKLWSQYTVEVPQFYDFVILKQGFVPYVIDSSNASRASFNIVDAGGIGAMQTFSFQANTVQHIWAQKNIPALKDEEYVTTLDNYISKVEFQLSSIRYPERPPIPILHDWYTIANDMMKDEDFGLELTRDNNWLKDDVKAATANAKNDEEKIRNIYTDVRETYNCIDDEAIWMSQPLKKTQQSKKGNVADINILLAAMLKVAGFEVHPAILSTRDNGFPYEVYPIMNQYNYVITEVKAADNIYVLDASDKDVGFNHLPLKCYNLSARVIADPPVLIEFSADSLHETKLTTAFVMNDEKGMSGSFTTQYSYFNSQDVRKAVEKYGKENYFTAIKKSIALEAEMSNSQIDSLKIPDEPVTVKYDVTFKAGEDDVIYFDPMLGNGIKDNPFKAAERYYPVEREYCTDETYLLNMEVPKGYKVDEMPKSARVNFNENEGMFEYIIAQGGGRIQLRCRVVLKKATFAPDDYESLREFFGFIVSKQAEQIVFKKE